MVSRSLVSSSAPAPGALPGMVTCCRAPLEPDDELFGRNGFTESVALREIAARVASFRETQQKFEREREEYYVTTLANALSGSGRSFWR